MIDQMLIQQCKNDVGEALRLFGAYSFDDKGPHEVMGVSEIIEKFLAMDPVDADETLQELAIQPDYEGRCEHLVSAILIDMQEWDEFWDRDPISGQYL